MAISQDNTDLAGRCTLLGELAHLINDLVGRGLEPCRRVARVRDRRGGNPLAVAVKTAHFRLVRALCQRRASGRKLVVSGLESTKSCLLCASLRTFNRGSGDVARLALTTILGLVAGFSTHIAHVEL